MNFNPDILLKILYESHINNTLNNPITYHIFEKKLNNYDKFIKDDIITEIISNVYKKYKEEPESKFKGSVDINPSIWVKIYLESMKNNNGRSVQVPNGCCNTNKCGIKKYYELIDKYIHSL
jgi:hypothetical protein